VAVSTRGASPSGDILAMFSAVIGEELAMKLAVAYGGGRLYIPKTAQEGRRIVEVIGERATEQLAKQYGGVSFEVPLERGKRERIIHMSTNANPPAVSEIARRVGCTERHVYQVRREYRIRGGLPPIATDEIEDKTQLDIFADKPNTNREG
jgi:hypothetical protein